MLNLPPKQSARNFRNSGPFRSIPRSIPESCHVGPIPHHHHLLIFKCIQRALLRALPLTQIVMIENESGSLLTLRAPRV